MGFHVFFKFSFLTIEWFMWMVHEIFHAMFEIKESSFCWVVLVYNDRHCEILKIIASLNSDVHESANSVVEVSSMWFSILFHLLSN